ncbi:MAG: prolyl oligopeptidase family serine peptidase [Desulfobacterales bacterium]|nr:prolyl oligopeptidase family serine peptidase [Desulfobacterales bacterium]
MDTKTMTVVQKLFLVVGVILFSACEAAHSPADTRHYTLTIGPSARTFLVHCPKNLEAANPPLVVALHGGGINGKTMERFSGLSEASERYGFIVVYPNGSGRLKRFLTWNAGSCCGYAEKHDIDDVAFIRHLIEYMIRQYHIDPSRVYVTGISNGAMMAYRLAAEIPDQIAAIAPVAGTLTIDPGSIHTPMPILHFHGTDDRYVPFEGGRGSRSVIRNSYMPVEETIKAWVRINQATAIPRVEELAPSHDDGTRVIRYTYRTEQDRQNIVLYKIIKAGHTWPGQPHARLLLGRTTTEISANDIMWEFFRAHVKRASDR